MRASLEGPRARIAAAREQLKQFNRLAEAFIEAHPPRIAYETSSEPGKLDIRVYDVPAVPIEFGINVGMIVHNLRAALDGLVCQLALLQAGGGNPNAVCAHTQFPIYMWSQRSKRGGWRKFPKATAQSVRAFSRYLALLELMQPYRRKNGQARSPLWRLHELSNTDKHRVLLVVTTTAAGVGINPRMRTRPDGSKFAYVSGIRISAGLVLKDGTKLGHYDGTSPDDVQVTVALRRELRFGGSCPPVARMPVVETLAQICNHAAQIVESFAAEFE